MKTNLSMIPNSASVLTVSDKHQKEYRVIFYFDSSTIKADFIGINKYGFWIANAMCLN